MAETIRQTVVNVTTTNTWTQLTEGAGGSAYAIPAGGKGIAKSLKAINLDSDPVTVEFAISTDGTISDAERIWPPVNLSSQYDQAMDEHNVTYAMQENEALWGRAVGTTPNVTFRADVLEITA